MRLRVELKQQGMTIPRIDVFSRMYYEIYGGRVELTLE